MFHETNVPKKQIFWISKRDTRPTYYHHNKNGNVRKNDQVWSTNMKHCMIVEKLEKYVVKGRALLSTTSPSSSYIPIYPAMVEFNVINIFLI